MIISPPLLKVKQADETDAAWIERILTVVNRRGYPVNGYGRGMAEYIYVRLTKEGLLRACGR